MVYKGKPGGPGRWHLYWRGWNPWGSCRAQRRLHENPFDRNADIYIAARRWRWGYGRYHQRNWWQSESQTLSLGPIQIWRAWKLWDPEG